MMGAALEEWYNTGRFDDNLWTLMVFWRETEEWST
jgi:hypothetical protein